MTPKKEASMTYSKKCVCVCVLLSDFVKYNLRDVSCLICPHWHESLEYLQESCDMTSSFDPDWDFTAGSNGGLQSKTWRIKLYPEAFCLTTMQT